MYFKINFQNKSTGSTSIKKTSEIMGEMFFRYTIEENTPIIHNGMLVLEEGTQFNTHQQSSWLIKKGNRKSFGNLFKINFHEPTKRIIDMNSSNIEWWNTLFEDNGISLLNISKFLTGNNPTGAQQNKSSSEFLLSDGNHAGKPFFNLLKAFSKKGYIKSTKFSEEHIKNAISFDDFLEQSTATNENVSEIIENFYSSQKYFYIDEAKEFLGIDVTNKKGRLRGIFRNKLISQYERKDQFYQVFTARKMVEAAHIKPVSHDASDEEIIDTNNGILLSPDIHKLFDSGAISFTDEGNVVYTTNQSKEPFNISKKEVNRLELDNFQLNKDLLVPERLEYLKYHRDNVYLKGV